MNMIDLLDKIPATFWGVIVGSAFTLSGVLATNWHAGKRLATQLKHDRELKAEDRELALRKDIYLEAAEALSEGMNSIIRFADLNIAHEELTKRFTEKAAAMAKVHVIADPDTAQALVNFMSDFSAAILTLSVKRSPLQAQHQQIAIFNDQVASFGKERDKLLEAIKQMNIEGIKDDRRFDVLNQSFEFEQDRIIKDLEKIKTLGDDLRKKQLEYLKECMASMHALRAMLLPVLTAVRNELKVPLDQSAYSRIMIASQIKERSQMEAFLEAITAPRVG